MNDRYRLPEVLGGAEYESVGKHGDMVGFDFPNFPDRMWLPASVVIKVEPPLEEPRTMGSVVQIDGAGLWVLSYSSPDTRWLGIHSRDLKSWTELCELGTPVRLVPQGHLTAALEYIKRAEEIVQRYGETTFRLGFHDSVTEPYEKAIADKDRRTRMIYVARHRAPEPSRRLFLAAAILLLGPLLPVALATPAHAQPVESNTSAARIVYPRHGEGVIAMTARTCGTAAPWRSVATANRIYGPAFVIYYGRAYTVSCVRPASTTASRSTAPRITSTWTHPLPGSTCVSGWGAPRSGHTHKGLDFPKPSGTPIRAAAAGRVVLVKWSDGAGWYVMLDHGRYNTVYMHMVRRSFLRVGTTVRAGASIGYVGRTGDATGNHLHFEVHDGVWHPINPAPFLRAHSVRVGC